ncbi:MAG: NAD(P)H-dependent glycerol-3-phosphate dehydrogenase [Peptococcaceae bacterium]|nr:NAD(P)H-dependent glycerol-3-phosphate dehydrogenase [Peptococcaceae bacterium]
MSADLCILGAGSWGTALAVALAQKNIPSVLWARNPNHARKMHLHKENTAYLPGITIPSVVKVTSDLEEAVKQKSLVIFVVPSHAFRSVLQKVTPLLPHHTIIVNAAKGLEENTLARLSQVYAAETGDNKLKRYVVLSGPSHAEEVGQHQPTALVAASPNMDIAETVQKVFMSPTLRVYTNPDIIGVELGGALKNIIALGTGIADGLGFGDNTKAALMTRGLAEITRLGVSLGAHPQTFGGLTGIGDLIVTCTSQHSRNRRAGIEIGRGKSLDEALKSVRMVVEGVRTTRACYRLAQEKQVVMPITQEIYRVLFEGLSPLEGVTNLMTRGRTCELEEIARIQMQITWDQKD